MINPATDWFEIKETSSKSSNVVANIIEQMWLGWFEIKETISKSSNVVANIIEQMWLAQYLWPEKVILDKGREFMKDFIMLIRDEYGTKQKPITTQNPQANAIMEQAHQTIGDLLCMFKIGTAKLDPDDPWGSILSTVMLALWSMIHMTHKAIPMQLVFGQDAMLNIAHLSNWWYIQDNQQKFIGKNNVQENAKQIQHEYKVNNKVIVKDDQKLKYMTDAYIGQCHSTKVHNKGTAHIKSVKIMDTYSIRSIMLYRK
eukprot:14814837-Ditylum_brightwellii.AAC.1